MTARKTIYGAIKTALQGVTTVREKKIDESKPLPSWPVIWLGPVGGSVIQETLEEVHDVDVIEAIYYDKTIDAVLDGVDSMESAILAITNIELVDISSIEYDREDDIVGEMHSAVMTIEVKHH